MNIIICGAPGSGKGTQAGLIAQHYHLKRITLGDILREEVKRGTQLGEEIKKYMSKGELVPDDIVKEVIEKNIERDNFILDGYPRNIKQAKTLEKIFEEENINLDYFIYLDVSKEEIIKRLSMRRICKKCGANYHLENMPPKVPNVCDNCGGDLFQRMDDTLEVIQRRWEVFSKDTQPLIDYYRAIGKLVIVDGNRTPQEVFNNIKCIVNDGKYIKL